MEAKPGRLRSTASRSLSLSKSDLYLQKLVNPIQQPGSLFHKNLPFCFNSILPFSKNKIKRKLLLSLTILCSSNCIVMSSNNNKILKNGAFFPDLVTCELRNPNSCFLHLLLFFYLRSLISGLWW